MSALADLTPIERWRWKVAADDLLDETMSVEDFWWLCGVDKATWQGLMELRAEARDEWEKVWGTGGVFAEKGPDDGVA